MDNQTPQTPAQQPAPAAQTTPPVTAPAQPIVAVPVTSAPTTPPTTTTPQQSAPTGSTPSTSSIKPKISFDFDSRTKLTVQWSAIWYGVGAIIESFASQISFYFMGGLAGELMRTFSFGAVFGNSFFPTLLKEAIWGVIIGAVVGFVLSKFYPQIQDLNRKYLKSKLNSMFKLLFYPSLVGAILGFLISTTAVFATGIMPLIIVAAGVIASSFIYAKMLSKKVEGLYQPPV